MSQHDYDLANAAGLAFRSDINNVLAAIISQNSGLTEPTTTFAYQFWADTTTGILKQRNAINSGWVSILTLSTGKVLLADTATTATTATNVTGSAVVTGAISSSSPAAGIGYATGAGGTVTQITSITTPVTLNKITGQITTVIAAIAADTIQSFTLNNNNITINDTIIVNFNNNYPRVILDCYISGSGTAVIRLNNPFATISASDIFYINFSIIKGATS